MLGGQGLVLGPGGSYPGRGVWVALVAGVSCHLADDAVTCCFRDRSGKQELWRGAHTLGKPEDIRLGLSRSAPAPIILGSRFKAIACPQARAKVRAEATTQAS